MAAGQRAPILAIGLVLVVIVTAWVSRVSEGRKAIVSCDSAFSRGDRVEAIVQARAAAVARCPFCASPEMGYLRLQAIAKDAESRGDDATAVAAWRAVRAASLSSVVFDTTPLLRQKADEEIARLEHRIDLASAAGGGGPVSPAASEERLRESLAANSVPGSTVFVFLTLGGVLFVIGAFRFVRARALRLVELAMAAAGAAAAAVGVLLF